MPHLFILLFKINLVLVLFAATYYLILRRLTFYVLNRVFLVFGILFSTLYPFIDLTDFFFNQQQLNQETVAFVPKMNQQVTEWVPFSFITEYWQWISILFYLGVIFMAFRLLVQFVSLYKMHEKSAPGSVADYQVRILAEPVSPFSFWQTVYINPSLHKEQELHTILAHEHIHVKQWHSLDIILAELSVVFYWFNPGVWLMKRAVKENLEFITDERILKKGIDKKAYQYSLLDVGALTPSVPIVNNFNLSDLKKRIKMMNVKRSSRLTLGRYLLVLPVLLLTTLAFTVTKKDIKKHLAPLQQVLIENHLMDAPKDSVATPKLTIKRVAKKKKEEPIEITIKKDSVQKFDLVFNAIFIETDSSKQSVDQDAVRNIKITTALAAANLPMKLRGSGVISDTSSVTRRLNAIQGSVSGIKLLKGEKIPTPDANSKTMETVTVIGYRKTTDSARRDKPKEIINFFVDGKRVSEAELKKLKGDNIKRVSITKQTLETPEVHVIGRMNLSSN